MALFRQVHDQLREELDGLDDDTLNWILTQEANSIATIVTHLVGSEAETLRCVAGVDCERDRAGLTWLIGKYGHAREHVGQVQLTKQLNQRDGDTSTHQTAWG
jgi:hypothetical protein